MLTLLINNSCMILTGSVSHCIHHQQEHTSLTHAHTARHEATIRSLHHTSTWQHACPMSHTKVTGCEAVCGFWRCFSYLHPAGLLFFHSLCLLSDGWFVCLFVCQQDDTKTTEWISRNSRKGGAWVKIDGCIYMKNGKCWCKRNAGPCCGLL